MAKPDTAPKANHHHYLAAWGTLEELLLACAVKRHGLQAWDSVSMELQSRTSLPPPFTSPHHCELKYRDLRRRFSSLHAASDDDSPAATTAAAGGDSGDKVDSIPWLEDLRKLRVAELRQGIQQSDDSIMSLQTKVKELTEEREESLREDQTSQQEPDLPVESKDNRSENDNAASGEQPPASVPEKAASAAAAKSGAGEEESDRENRSVNGSNSTGVKSEKTGPEAEPKVEDEEDEPARPLSGSDKLDRVSNESRPEGMDSYNGSSEPNRGRTVEESEEPSESKENSSDVQSSASLTKKKKRGKGRRRVDEISVAGRGGESPVADDASPAANLAGTKPQPLVDILKMIRAHDSSSLFERRLSVQEKDKYRSIVRQHMDLETIHSRLQKGSYSTCLFSFYRDLLLLFSNALVFYPKSSPESVAARELHRLVSTEIQKKTAPTRTNDSEPAVKPDPERPDSLLAKQKSAAPIVVCRKRSSITAKPPEKKTAPTPAPAPAPAETKPPVKSSTSSPSAGAEDFIKIKEKSVTGARSLRRSNTSIKSNNNNNNNSSGGKKPAIAAASEPDPDPKKGDGSGSGSGSTKKRSAADFLKRMKRSSPAGKSKDAGPADSKNSKGSGGGGNGGNEPKKKKTTGKVTEEKATKATGGGGKNTKEESGSPSKRTVGRPPKKGAGGDSGVVGAKRGRESAPKEAAAATAPTPAAIKRPRKRTRR